MDRRVAAALVLAALVAVTAVFVFSSDGPEDTCTVSAGHDYGISGIDGTGTYAVGDAVTLEAHVKPGFVFDGWYGEAGKLSSETVFTMSASDIRLEARTVPADTVFVGVKAGIGITDVSGSGSYSSGTEVTVTAQVGQRYLFGGWYDEDGLLFSRDITYTFGAIQVTLVAKAVSPDAGTVELSGDGGVSSVSGSGTYAYGDPVRISAAVIPGHSFLGWFTPSGSLFEECEDATVEATGLVLEARTSVNPYVTAEFSGDKGVSSLPESGRFPAGTEILLEAGVKPGYSFDGWYLPDGSLFSRVNGFTLAVGYGGTELSARTVPGYTVEVLHMSGVSASGGGQFTMGGETVLKAVPLYGDCFSGWFDLDGNLVSASPEFVPAKEDTILVAGSDRGDFIGDHRISFAFPKWYGGSSYTLVLDSFSGCLVDSFTGRANDHTDVSSGRFDIVYRDASGRSSQETVDVGDGIVQHYYWKHGGKDYTLEWEFPRAAYEFSLSMGFRQPHNDEVKASFAHDRTGQIGPVAQTLASMLPGANHLEKAEFILDFVQQNSVYQYDREISDYLDHWKYPIETLVEHRGDCEDTSILYAALMGELDYSCVLVELGTGEYDITHITAAVSDFRASGKYFEHDGQRYYACETTSKTADIGDWNWGDRFTYSHTIKTS